MNNLDVNRDPFYFNSSGKSLFGVLHYRNDDISNIDKQFKKAKFP